MKKLVLLSLSLVMALLLVACVSKTYTVKIDPMNGEEAITLKVESGKVANFPQNITKEGYVFAGWFEGDQEFNTGIAITDNHNVYGKWIINKYTVTFINAGTQIAPVEVEHGSLLTEPIAPTREHYVFREWTDGNDTYDFSKPVTSNLYLYGEFNLDSYQVVFDTLGGTQVSAQTVPAKGYASIPASPTKEGSQFDGWYIADKPFNFSDPILKDTIVTAKWRSFAHEAYYDGMEGLTGANLIIFLNNLLEQMQGKNYDYAKNALQVSDRDPNNSSNLIEFYTGQSRRAQWDAGNTWNREHVWPQSLLGEDAGSTINSASDLHNLKPSDKSINTSRSNKWFGPSTTPYSYAPNRQEIKGDIARILFYMDIRYDRLSLVNLTGVVTPYTYQMGDLATLLLWHAEDPVDDFERNRNNVIYGYQGNRNPFVDYPELVGHIYN
ncbi:putative repeat protein (TIGR02543 family) [Acholeplasma morum]|uniref:endonuclease n=1 Tax=Paracholeplasma morum TaxID=264637 RepID=UPI001959F02E|nr:endonuclease [Paracholeplasma morum]MBM7453569.1 putative repeat protein (TIGR02543 family) [Paracholeplasma morum]